MDPQAPSNPSDSPIEPDPDGPGTNTSADEPATRPKGAGSRPSSRSKGAGQPSSSSSRGRRDEKRLTAVPDERRARSVVTWDELERIADEAADVDAIVRRELSEGVAPSDPAPLVEITRREWPRRSRWPAMLAVASLVALGVVFATNARQERQVASSSPAPRSAAPSSTPSQSPAAPSTVPAPPPSLNQIKVQLVFSAPCWVSAVADGVTVLQQTLSSGARTIRARHTLELTLGNAGGVGLLLGGTAVPTGGSTGAVVHFTFTLRHGSVVTS